MRKLTDNEKENVKLLLEHKGFKILEELLEEFESATLKKYLTLDIRDKVVQDALSADKDYLKGARHFSNKAKASIKGVGKKQD